MTKKITDYSRIIEYHCQVCGKKHKLKGTWTKDAQLDMQMRWKINLDDEMMQKLFKEIELAFYELHPEGKFNKYRVIVRKIVGINRKENENG